MKINNYIVILVVLLIFSSACNAKQGVLIEKIEIHLASILHNIDCSEEIKLIILSENSCSLCYQHVDFEWSRSQHKCNLEAISKLSFGLQKHLLALNFVAKSLRS